MKIRVTTNDKLFDCWLDLEPLINWSSLTKAIRKTCGGAKYDEVTIIELKGQPAFISHNENLSLSDAIHLERIISTLHDFRGEDGASVLSSFLEVFPNLSWRDIDPWAFPASFLARVNSIAELGAVYAEKFDILKETPKNYRHFFNFKAFGEYLLASDRVRMCHLGRVFICSKTSNHHAETF